jgi:predicted lipoprotein with Yx(FWY)xxD motif
MNRRLFSLLLAGMLVLAACGDDADGGSDGTDAAAEGVSTASTDLGTVLVDPDGFTMYVFTNDTDGESTCYDACADTWPAVPGDAAISSDLDDSIFGTTARTDGTEQLTVDGQPLYLYTPDTNPGDTTGQGVGEVWFVVGADGAMIGGPEAAADQSRGDYDYGD